MRSTTRTSAIADNMHTGIKYNPELFESGSGVTADAMVVMCSALFTRDGRYGNEQGKIW